jgi:amino acid transporter
MSEETKNGKTTEDVRRRLSLFDSCSLIVGIIIGAGIFTTSPFIAANAPTLTILFGLWVAGGIISIMGALCYAELGSTYPQACGDYHYLTKAYGSWAGFLFGWLQTVIARPGDIALMAIIFATYAAPLVGGDDIAQIGLAAGAVALLTAINILGVQFGKTTQNVLTTLKVIGLIVVFGVAVAFGQDADVAKLAWDPDPEEIDLGLAMILILFTFGGWNEMAYVVAEVKDPARNISRSLIGGLMIVTLLYIFVSLSFVTVLGHAGLAASKEVGRDVISHAMPRYGPALMSGLIMIAALGSLNGLIFAGSRITYAVGRDYPVFAILGKWNSRTGTPIRALVLQGLLACILITVLRSFTKTLLYTAAPVYCFYLATSLSVLVLRRKDPTATRPFRLPGYPFVPVLFATSCVYFIYRALLYKPIIVSANDGYIGPAGVALMILAAGIPIYFLARRK